MTYASTNVNVKYVYLIYVLTYNLLKMCLRANK